MEILYAEITLFHSFNKLGINIGTFIWKDFYEERFEQFWKSFVKIRVLEKKKHGKFH